MVKPFAPHDSALRLPSLRLIWSGAIVAAGLGLSSIAHASHACCGGHSTTSEFQEVLRTHGVPVPEPEPEWRRILPEEVRAIAVRIEEDAPPTPAAPPPAESPFANLDEKHRKDLEADLALGKEVAQQVEKELKLTDNPQMVERVRRIGNELAEIARQTQVDVTWGDRRLNPFPYTFHVIQGEDVNAFSLPGGFIYVYEGLLKYAETDHELAGVLAHEIAHAAFRHVATLQREQSRLSAITLPLILIGLFSGSEAGAGISQAANLTNQAIGSGWSVRAEKSADLGGFQYLRSSRFNPTGLLTFMERLAFDERAEGRIDWGIFRSHPPSRDRVNAILGMFRGAGIPVQRSVSSTTLRALPVEEADGTHTLRLLKRTIAVFRGADAASRAEEAANRLNPLLDRIPAVFDIDSRPGGAVLVKGEVIFRFGESDLAESETVAGVTDRAVRELKAAAFELQYRVWDN